MISAFDIYALKSVINSPRLEPYKAENFNELFPTYRDNELEEWKEFDGSRVALGNTGQAHDRTGTLPHYLKLVDYEPLPIIPKDFSKSFKEICFERAKEIIRIADGQRINISWSGGLDSTTLLFCFLEIGDPKQFKVFCNYNSIVESGVLFDKYIKNKLEYDLNPPVVSPQFGEGVIVTGYHGDALFPHYNNLLFNNCFYGPWEDWISNEQHKIIDPILENYPVKITTIQEFQSFLEINFKWQWSKTFKKRNIVKSVADRILNFYDSVDFQIWAMANYEPKYIDERRNTWKWPERELLRELIGKCFYTENKLIQRSHYNVTDPNWVMLLEDGTNLYRKDLP
jgi:hypothetical protein